MIEHASIEVEGNDLGPAQTLVLPMGGRLMDACDRAAAPVPFSCRDAHCGTCLIAITFGVERLESAELREQQLLALLDHALDGRHRLACQVRTRGAGLVKLRLGH